MSAGEICSADVRLERKILKTGGSTMKKKFKMQDLDCAHCAAKMEEAIEKIDGVNDAAISSWPRSLP